MIERKRMQGRGRERGEGGREGGREEERERERERIPSRLHTVSTEPNAGLELTNCRIMAEPKPGVGHSTD